MTAKIEMTQEARTRRVGMSKLIWVSPAAMAASTVANLALYAAAGAIFPGVTAWPGAGIGQIIGANIVYLLMGTVIFALIARFTSRPVRLYKIVATIGLILSLGLPISAGFGYGAPAADVATVVTLSLMHVVSYAISVPLFIRYALD